MNYSPRPSRKLSLFFSILILSIASFEFTRLEGLSGAAKTESVDSCDTVSPALITWSPVEMECPICQTKNIFMMWDTYGSYIYQFPSKYQFVFWPQTDSAAWYSCKKCRYTAFMGDFKDVPKEKIPELKQTLAEVSLPQQKELSEKESLENPPYLGIPTSAKLVVAERVYRTLGRSDDEFWNHFYRVMGYHFDLDKKPAQADEVRRKALEINDRLLADKTNEGERKRLLYISGALRHFLRDDVAALKDFEEARKLTYASKDLEPEQKKNFDDYLSSVIKEYIERLHEGEGPRTRPAH